eukprot:CAMPEP_0204576476 /NCGR_PEP_ID=MMETSP0661-20131031/41795_1 /ASSEMBLY_ACC=CAM_ASM_000606 /TAXON_ID=109239 /ORGANISM="Alexandrium margalefi, Strain AMGDE01CS-322" /LENGTH=147 /DNA_ID=CAMNT_0051585231 /DNA_START=89 /DNA_END=535 /DNA_ORIENTATION=-
MAALRAGLLLLVAGLSLAGSAKVRGRAESDNFLKAGASIKAHHSALREQMRSMMEDSADDVDFRSLTREGRDSSKRSMMQLSGPAGGTASMEDYIKDAEEGLAAALGPKWSARALEEDANRKTSALLRGISSPKAMHAINRMLGAMG